MFCTRIEESGGKFVVLSEGHDEYASDGLLYSSTQGIARPMAWPCES